MIPNKTSAVSKRRLGAALALLSAAALCVSACQTIPAPSAEEQFFTHLTRLCGQAFSGRLTSNDPADGDFAGKPLVMHVRSCAADEIRIPFHVGEDRSRTWVITRTGQGLRLKHDHRHQDGTPDVLTQYGGDSNGAGDAVKQHFPVDQFSKDLFAREGRTVSLTNVWTVEHKPGVEFAYALNRENRHFRVAFDLTRAAPAPAPPWGAQTP
jgi:hypothetical protein